MKETFERSLWAFLVCVLCVVLAILFTFAMLTGGNFSDEVIATFTPDAADAANAQAAIQNSNFLH